VSCAVGEGEMMVNDISLLDDPFIAIGAGYEKDSVPVDPNADWTDNSTMFAAASATADDSDVTAITATSHDSATAMTSDDATTTTTVAATTTTAINSNGTASATTGSVDTSLTTSMSCD